MEMKRNDHIDSRNMLSQKPRKREWFKKEDVIRAKWEKESPSKEKD